MKQFWLTSMLQDGIDGSISSKRVITFIAFVLCCVAFMANLFWKMEIAAFIFESMSYIAMAGLGTTVAEKFSSRTTVNNGYQPLQNNAFQSFTQPSTPTPTRTHTPLPKQEDPLI